MELRDPPTLALWVVGDSRPTGFPRVFGIKGRVRVKADVQPSWQDLGPGVARLPGLYHVGRAT